MTQEINKLKVQNMFSLGRQSCVCIYSKTSFEMWSLWGND